MTTKEPAWTADICVRPVTTAGTGKPCKRASTRQTFARKNHNLNRGDWKELEESCRRWAQEEGKIYIVCGPILYDQRHRTIGKKHKITVPEAFFKVVLCADSNPPKAIGFIYKNASGNHPLDSYVNTVDEVERITGIDFFPALPDEIEEKVEAEYDLKLW